MAGQNSSMPLRIAIIGQGYVGLPLAKAFVEAGTFVAGIESNPRLSTQLSSGISHVEDISNAQLSSMLETNRYIVETKLDVISSCQVVIICVPTPLDDNGSPDLSILIKAVQDVSPHLINGAILISESTSYPGTLRNLIAPIVLKLSKFGSGVLLATAPERVDPGNEVWNQRNTPRLIGGLNEKSTARAVEVYSQISSSLQVVSSPEIAEAAKLLENSFRLVNIAFINEFAQAMANLSINALEVIEAANTKPYGFMRFTPGLGAGGHCIPVDPVYLSDFFSKSNVEHQLLERAISSNREAFKFVVTRVRSLTVQPKRILIIGLSYKEGISDLRESPAEQIFRELDAEYEVDFYDERILSIENLKRSEALEGFDLVLILVPQKNLNLETLVSTNTIVWNCTGTLITVPGVTNIYDGSEND